MEMLTEEKREALRRDYLNEVGTEPPCPMCGKPRVKRSTYVRCNGCGENWQAGDDLTISASLSRYRKLMQGTRPTPTGKSGTAPNARSTSEV